MNVLFLNATDIEGGAGRAAYRLLTGMRGLGVPARMLVQRKSGDDPAVIGPATSRGKVAGIVRPHLDQLLLRFYPRRQLTFFPAVLPDSVAADVAPLAPDLVHLHWVAGGFLRVETLRRLGRPLVWTLHDSWPFTGGCTMPLECRRYEQRCGQCPILGSARERDLSRWLWKRKHSAWKGLDLTIVTPSRWLGAAARASALFRDARVEVIPNGLDLVRFRPHDRRYARELLGLPQDRRLILFIGMNIVNDRNKGFHLLLPALEALRQNGWGEGAEVVVAGCSDPPPGVAMPLTTHFLGRLHDDVTLALLYSAADIFVLPSIQENLPNTVMEAMACGTPTVAFDQGGVPDLVAHGRTGFLARPGDPGDLARCMAGLLDNDAQREAFGHEARRVAEGEYSLETVARRYCALYEEILRR